MAPTKSVGDCPDGYSYNSDFDKCYQYHSTAVQSQSLAEDICKETGGALVTINSYQENSFVASLSGGALTWIGLSDRDIEGQYKWESGTAPIYTNFNYGNQ